MTIVKDEFHLIVFHVANHHAGVRFRNLAIPVSLLVIVYQHIIHHAGLLVNPVDFNAVTFQRIGKNPLFKGHFRFLPPDVIKQALHFQVRIREHIIGKQERPHR